jgi:1-acyl-sn-glycerol-3-phosphate acyltransferase
MKFYFLSPLILQKLIWIPTNILLRGFGRLKIRGTENLEGLKGPVIFACNHTSETDPFFVPASLPFFSRFSPIFYTSRESKFYVNSGWRKYFYGGTFFKAWGSYPVHVGLHDYEKSLAHHIDILRAGGSLCIFPEGRTTPDGNIQPAKGGVSYLAYVTGAPVVPVRIGGVFRFSFKDFLLGRRHLSIAYGKPMRFLAKHNSNQSGITPLLEDFKSYANLVMGEVGKL